MITLSSLSAIALLFCVPFTSLLLCKSQGNPLTENGRTMEKELKAAYGQKLSIDLQTGGLLNISGWDKEMIWVKAYLDGKDSPDCKVDVLESAGGVKIVSLYAGGLHSHSTDFKFEIKMPEKFDIEIDSSGGGINIANLVGTVEGQTGGGRLTITRAKGNVRLSTGGGDISVSHSNLDGSVSTGGGQIVFEDVAGSVKGFTGGGKVTYKDVSSHTKPASADELRIRKAGGKINVDDAPNGADLQTGGGSIHVNSARGFVKASTGGGSITIDVIDGEVRATTGAGRIDVTMVGDSTSGRRDVYLTSGNGDITLVLPANISADFDIRLAYTNTDKAYQIVSDFNLNQRSTNDWSNTEGTSRKYIYGTGSIKGGNNKIKIDTVNGNIYIKRGR